MTKFTFECGTVVTLRRVNGRFVTQAGAAARRKYLEKNPLPECPVYTRELAGGEIVTYKHNETTIIEDEFQNPEIQEEWNQYFVSRSTLGWIVFEQTAKAWLWRGIVEDVPQEWLNEQKTFGIPLPEKETKLETAIEVKFEWIRNISIDWPEVLDCVSAIRDLPNPTEAAAQDSLDGFRD
jgi:hypothetical protein